MPPLGKPADATARPQPPFRERMVARLERWYRAPDPQEDPQRRERRAFLAGLVNKTAMRTYVAGLGLPLPALLVDRPAHETVDFARLPDRIVVKPDNSADSRGVILLAGDRNLMNGDHVADRAAYVQAVWAAERIPEKPGTRILVEELLADYDPAYAIPRDFKVFVGNGRAQIIQVIDRNPPEPQRTHAFFRRDWTPIRRKVKIRQPVGPVYDRPPALDRLIAMADLIARDLGVFYRLDFYMTPAGPVFGEFTSYPAAGLGFTVFGDHLMCGVMGRHPEPI